MTSFYLKFNIRGILIIFFKFQYVITHLLKFNPIGKEIAPKTIETNIKIDPVKLGEELKNFDQWTEALTRDISVQNDEDNAKVLWRMDEFFDEEIEEEE